MASETAVAEQRLVLTPPDPVPTVAPEKAAGLVPVDEGKKSELEKRVDGFIDDLVAQDVNSPEFGKRVDAIAAMGQKEIREAAGQSNRFLDRPVKAMDGEGGVGTDLIALRRQVEDLDPSKNGKLIGGKGGFLDRIFGSGGSRSTSTNTSRRRATSTRSSRAWPMARTSSSWTMPRSIPSARTCGTRWAGWSR